MIQADKARFDDRFKARLTSWSIDQAALGALPEVTSRVLETVERQRNLLPQERADRLLRGFARMSGHLGEEISFNLGLKMDLGSDDAILLAWSESVNATEVEYLIRYIEERRWIRVTWRTGNHDRAGHVVITPEGYARLAELEAKTIDSSQAFVAMWFSQEMAAIYSEAIEPAIRDTGYKSLRIDQKEHINKIDDEIIAEIRRSRFLVADFTAEIYQPEAIDGRSEDRRIYVARGGVYYEAGFAQGLNIPVIWTCRQDIIGHVHFDTRQFNHIDWKSPQDLYTRLKNRIGAIVGDGPLKKRIQPSP